jgi:hypothetical protein
MMLLHRCRLACAGLALAALATPSTLHAQTSTPDDLDVAARSEFEQGASEYDRGHFMEALAHYERAYVLSPRPKLLFNIGRAAEGEGKLERAIEAYAAYLDALPDGENRPFVEGRLAKLRERANTDSKPSPPPAPAPVYQPRVTPYPVRPPPAKAPPNEGPGSFRLHLGLHVGMRGSMDFDTEFTSADATTAERYSLKPSVGLQLGAGFQWRIFGVGVELRQSFIKLDVDGESARRPVLGVLIKPRVGYTLRSIPLAFYGSIPLGACVPVGDELLDPGFNLQVVAGVNYFFTRHVGINFEAGLQAYFFSYDASAGQLPHTYENEEGTASSQELMLGTSLVYAL